MEPGLSIRPQTYCSSSSIYLPRTMAVQQERPQLYQRMASRTKGQKTRSAWLLIFLVATGLSLFANRDDGRLVLSSTTASSKACSCSTFTFPPRFSAEEQAQYWTAWNQTKYWVKERKLTFLRLEVLDFHYQKLLDIERQGIPGMILECGVAKAGSAITFAAIKHPKRCLHLFDTFEGIPPPSVEMDGPDVLERYRQIQVDKQHCLLGLDDCKKDYYGNMDDLLAFDQEQFRLAGFPPAKHSVYFHKGLFDDTVWPDGPVAYAHLDGDWYHSTYNMLERISPFLSMGGYFVLDDVYFYSGSKDAFIDFFQVDMDWLQNNSTHTGTDSGGRKNRLSQCWTTVSTSASTTTRSATSAGRQWRWWKQEQQQTPKKYYVLTLDVKAMAQAVSESTVLQQRSQGDPNAILIPRCVPPPSSSSSRSIKNNTHFSKSTTS